MRELKFRAWDIENKKWLKDWSSYKAGGSEQYFVGFNGDLGCHRTIVGLPMPMFDIDDEPDGIILEQYTGLKDKNGKEICIGDVVSEHQGDIVGEIVQKPSGEYRIAWIGIFGGESVLYDHHSLCEVIGNIHENPELIEKEKE